MRVDEKEVAAVRTAILATKVPQRPQDKISEVLCDADLMHLTSEDYFEQMEKLRMEWKLTGRNDLNEYQFHLNSINFFKDHHYHSEYGRTVLAPQKESVRQKIIERVSVLKSE